MKVGVAGAGSWGTTLANLLVRNGHDVTIWAREPAVVESINTENVNRLFLPDCVLSDKLVATGDLSRAVSGAALLVSAAPSHAVRTVAQTFSEFLEADTVVVSVSKGLEPKTLFTMSEVLEETVSTDRIAVLSGPSFALEVYQQKPTAVVAASRDRVTAELVQAAFSNSHFRVYTSSDMLGVQLGGALKNVIALAAGIVDGLGLGYNPRAALITRGLAELTRLGEALGANPRTFAGLAGLGDLLLTATGDLSRNRTVGIELGRGRTLDKILAERITVAEGVNTARSAVELGSRANVELPIAWEISQVLFDGKKPEDALRDLMERELKAEHWR